LRHGLGLRDCFGLRSGLWSGGGLFGNGWRAGMLLCGLGRQRHRKHFRLRLDDAQARQEGDRQGVDE
jgi:hypothetical protein